MDISIMQPYLFPYIGYFQLINCSDYFVVADNVQFIKRGWINRNKILINGKAHMITVPVIKDSAFLDIKERCFIDDPDAKFRNKTLNTIYHAYHKAPNFDECYELVRKILNFSNTNVVKYNYNSLEKICSYLDIKTIFLKESELNAPSELSYQDTAIYLCNKFNAERYINAIGGTQLYSAKKFRENGIKLKFVKTRETLIYKQYGSDFVPGLSIIDVMMFNSREEIRQLLTEYDLIDGNN